MSKRLGYKLIPPAGIDALTPIFDRLSMENSQIRRDLLTYMGVRSESTVLDLGSGPGAQSSLTAKAFPDIKIVAMEPDKRSISIAQEKSQKRNLGINFARGVAEELPFKSDTFDFVMSTAMIHHLPTESKKRCFVEVKRILKRGGTFGILEMGKPRTLIGKIFILPLKLRSFEFSADCMNGLLPSFLEGAGFVSVAEHRKLRYLFGSAYIARKP